MQFVCPYCVMDMLPVAIDDDNISNKWYNAQSQSHTWCIHLFNSDKLGSMESATWLGLIVMTFTKQIIFTYTLQSRTFDTSIVRILFLLMRMVFFCIDSIAARMLRLGWRRWWSFDNDGWNASYMIHCDCQTNRNSVWIIVQFIQNRSMIKLKSNTKDMFVHYGPESFKRFSDYLWSCYIFFYFNKINDSFWFKK